MSKIIVMLMFINSAVYAAKPIVAQYFGIRTEKGQAWEQKFRDDAPFTKLNRLYIVYARLIKTRNHHFTLKFDGDETRAIALIDKVRAVNPDAEIFVTLRGVGTIQSFLGAARDSRFAGNVIAFLQRYGLNGLDIDWEEGISQTVLIQLLKNLYTSLHPQGYQLTLDATQYVSPGYDVSAMKDYVDQINIASYGTGIDLAVCASDYAQAGFPLEKIIGGIITEYDYHDFEGIADTLGMTGTIAKKAAYARKAGLAGMMAWRMDNDYATKKHPYYPSYKGTLALWDAMVDPLGPVQK